MGERSTYFAAIVFVALALVPAGAHVAELLNKMPLDAAAYRTVQQIYRGWALFGVIVFGALASTLVLAVVVRRHPAAFRPALLACLCIAGTQLIFWTATFPVNQMTANWTVLPDNWMALRARWEYSHAASAVLNFVALLALVLSVLRRHDIR
jgi:hypothetical protein